jgi:hypothetical protein
MKFISERLEIENDNMLHIKIFDIKPSFGYDTIIRLRRQSVTESPFIELLRTEIPCLYVHRSGIFFTGKKINVIGLQIDNKTAIKLIDTRIK